MEPTNTGNFTPKSPQGYFRLHPTANDYVKDTPKNRMLAAKFKKIQDKSYKKWDEYEELHATKRELLQRIKAAQDATGAMDEGSNPFEEPPLKHFNGRIGEINHHVRALIFQKNHTVANIQRMLDVMRPAFVNSTGLPGCIELVKFNFVEDTKRNRLLAPKYRKAAAKKEQIDAELMKLDKEKTDLLTQISQDWDKDHPSLT
jgi:hypothetical protein